MKEIVMPKLSDTMTEGRLVSWKKQVGEAVQRGDVLAEVETDKANMELEAFVSGVLLEIRVPAGELAQVGTVIGVVGQAEEKGAPAPQPKAPEQAEPVLAAPAAPVGDVAPAEPAEVAPKETPAEVAPKEAPAEVAPKEALAEVVAVQEEKQQPSAAAASLTPHAERAAPVVRRRARELGIDLGQVKGSGPEGRILLQDLECQQDLTPGPAAPGAEPLAAEVSEPLSRLRSAVARTVAESWGTIPHFSVTTEVLMDEAEAVRRQLKDGGIAVTLNDLVVKGAALALQKFPRLNASFAGDAIKLHAEINIGVAVGLPDGVLVPVIPGCQRLSLREIATAARGLVDRSRGGALSEKQMSGGTFSVSNLGMYGVSQFSAIIYPTQAAVLAVGAVSDAVVARAGVPTCARLMKLTLSADHRVVDGAYAAEFLAELKDILENPVRMLI